MKGSKSRDNPTFAVVTMGCPKNSVETEFIEDSLIKQGYSKVSLEEARIIIVNTCGFIQAAKEESIEAILEASSYKETGCCDSIIVVGCLAQRYHNAIFKEIPEIDALIGLSHHKELPCYIPEILKGQRICKVKQMPSHYSENRGRNISGNPSAYLQISDGCNNSCAYCAIPKIRGIYRSRPIPDLLAEAKSLVEQGVKEIVLIGQDTAFYGYDIYGEIGITDLIKELAKLEELDWIRLLYCQPQNISDQLIEAIASNSKFCPYIDVPFQHASKSVLRRMRRSGDPDQYSELIERIRRKIPKVALRTSFIVGFPGETDQEFDELLEFVAEINFDYVGLFEYSIEEDTIAASLPNRAPTEIIRERSRTLSDLQDRLVIAKEKSHLGKIVQVLLEGISDEKRESAGNYLYGRTIYQAPEIDGQIEVKNDGNCLKLGDMIEAKITKADIYDFEGEYHAQLG